MKKSSDHGELQFVDDVKAAEILGAGLQTLRNWRWRGEGPPFFKFGHSVRYEVGELRRYAESRRRTSTSEAA